MGIETGVWTTRLLLVDGGASFLPEMMRGGAIGGGTGLAVEATGRLGGVLGFSKSTGSGGMSTAQGAGVTEKLVIWPRRARNKVIKGMRAFSC